MKRIIILLFCICLYQNNIQAAHECNYVEFARTYGIIRYFSPNPYTLKWSESDWMKVCALLVSRSEKEPLETVFKTLAPTLSFSDYPIASHDKSTESTGPAYYYSYSGSGELNIPFLAKLIMPGLSDYMPYYKNFSMVPNNLNSDTIPISNRYYSYLVLDNKYLNIQHAMPKEIFDDKETHRLLTDAKSYWKNHHADDKSLSKSRRFIFGLLSDKSVRVADIVVRWNIVRHFYPYYNEDDFNWDRQLEIYLEKAILMDDVNSYESLVKWYEMLGCFLNPIKDGHTFLSRDMAISSIKSAYLPEYYAETETKYVNDTLLIRTGSDSKHSWRILKKINEKPASEIVQYYRETTNAATEAHRDFLAGFKILCSSVFNTPFIVQSCDLSGKHIFKDTLYARRPDAFMPIHKSEPIRNYKNGILYIDATSPELNENKFLSAITPGVKKLCFDLRGLPSVKFEDILSHLISTDVSAPATEVPVNSFPFQQKVSWRVASETLKSKSPHVNLPATFLCDASTVSWGETILMMVRHYKLGDIIGQATAGTTGDMTQFNLPMFPFSMTGMRMHCMDGSSHHARGIVPDRIIPLYAKDFIERFDRTLKTALNN